MVSLNQIGVSGQVDRLVHNQSESLDETRKFTVTRICTSKFIRKLSIHYFFETFADPFALKTQKAITWLSEIWAGFDPHRIRRSFDECGLTDYIYSDLHSGLKHVLESKEQSTISGKSESVYESKFASNLSMNLYQYFVKRHSAC